MAPNRPILAKYPYLHGLLKNDPKANSEFNAAIADVTGVNVRARTESDLQDKLERSETNLNIYIDKVRSMTKLAESTVQFIRLLGEIIEEQTEITPFTEDLAKMKSYKVKFTSTQIRLALRLHWDVIGASMESEIGRSLVMDPAAEREGT